jgi:hypothetical protein
VAAEAAAEAARAALEEEQEAHAATQRRYGSVALSSPK